MKNKSIFLVSVNSQRLNQLVRNGPIDNELIFCSDLFVFDIVEILNGLFFQEYNIFQQKEKIENTILLVKQKLISQEGSQRFIRYSEITKLLKPYLSVVYNEYYTNAKFERHVKSQIFQNLQPKLRSVSITSHKSDLIELLTPYLLAEVAFYLYLFDKPLYDIIYGFEAEMNIVTAIRNGKYPSFELFLRNKISYNKLQID